MRFHSGLETAIRNRRKDAYKLRKIKIEFPDETNATFVMKYHITSIVDAIDETFRAFEK